MTAMTAAAKTSAELRPWVRRAVRVGYAAKGIIYLLIGTLAIRLAMGLGGELTDSSGALRTIVQQPFGTTLLAIVGIGILAYAGWEITEGIAVGDTVIRTGILQVKPVDAVRIIE